MTGSALTHTTRFERLIRIDHRDPTQARRGQLLNILLLSVGVASIIGIAAAIFLSFTQSLTTDWLTLIVSGLVMLAVCTGLYILNRRGSPRLAATLFLLILVVVLSFSDEPRYLVGGRSTVTFVLPIIMASVVLSPASSFIFASLVSIDLVVLALDNAIDPGLILVGVLGFYLVALIGWLAARSLENALDELRVINQELDQRVADRTRDLAEALIRVQAEAGKNQAILESIADGVIVFDDRGQAAVANPAIAQLLDLPSDQILGRDIDTLMQGVVNDADRAAVASALYDTEHRPTTKFQWAKKTLSASFAPVQLGAELHQGTVGVFRDFTREAELDRMKSMFVSMVSHELRTPLNAILGYSEILRERIHGPLTERQAGLVDRLNTNTKRLLSLVGDLLDRTQLEAGKLSLRNSTVMPAALVDDVVAMFGSIAQAKGLELTTTIATDVPKQLRGDPQRLGQILINLVGNAVKFTDRGQIRVSLARPDEAHWLMTVADTGCGIPADEQSHVFDWFRQVDNSVTREHSGVGLGLSIVKQLVLLMGGEITLQSEVGRGSTFAVRLPLITVEEKIS